MADVMSVYRVQDNGLTIKRAKDDNTLLQKGILNIIIF